MSNMEKLENIIRNTVLVNYYKKNNKLPSYGHSLVATNVMKTGDMLDYMLDNKNGYIHLKYTYYENSKEERKYITSSIILHKEQ